MKSSHVVRKLSLPQSLTVTLALSAYCYRIFGSEVALLPFSVSKGFRLDTWNVHSLDIIGRPPRRSHCALG